MRSRKTGFTLTKFLGFCQSSRLSSCETRSEASEYRRRWPVKSIVQIAMGSLCCNAHQIDVIVAVCAYTVLILGTWRVDAVVKPFKLLAVFVHEGCHACACLATGGRVDGVEVNINEGGVTRYRGGWRLCVTPAGYLGGALWAAICTAVLDYRWGIFCVAAHTKQRTLVGSLSTLDWLN